MCGRNEEIKLPIGIEDFKTIRSEGFYYVDKTGLIKDLLNKWSLVNLFTRPRRFGKSLNMSMLKCFFEYGCNSELFDGLAIAQEQALCKEYMGKYPVISISLKSIEADDFDAAKAALRNVIGDEASRFEEILQSDRISTAGKTDYSKLIERSQGSNTRFAMSDDTLISSLRVLSGLLHKHYNQKAIILIDEYDVPLDKAYKAGYYDEMVSLIRNLFGNALKTNCSLQFAVLTGCLRISKESIFTGLNNLRVYSIADVQYDEHFGFAEDEVRQLLAYYNLSNRAADVKEWYDGYRFGDTDVYCPWDVINCVADLRIKPTSWLSSYWVNSSGNEIVRSFLRKATSLTTKREVEELIAGQTITKKIDMNLTYNELDKSIENLWSVLFMTGYLTQAGNPEKNVYQLKIPNLEIREIFTEQIYKWFEETAAQDGKRLEAFCAALESGDAAQVEEQFGSYLRKTISIRDTFVRKSMKENFYHGILLGLVSFRDSWDVSSNRESGEGYSDILIENHDKGIGIIIEVKYPDDKDLEAGCKAALDQIETLHYDEPLRDNGAETILKYGIACYEKKCRVEAAKG